MGQIQNAASGLANSMEGSVKAILLKKIQQAAEGIADKGNVKAKASPYTTDSDVTPSYTVDSDIPETPNFNYDPYTQMGYNGGSSFVNQQMQDNKYNITPYDQQMAMKAQTRLLSYQKMKGLPSGNGGNYWSGSIEE